MIAEQIRSELTPAMKERNELKVRVLRGLLASFTNELVAQKKRPDETITDEDALKVIKRGVKQRLDSIEQFEKGGRNDLAKNERQELELLKIYLPQTMGMADIEKVALAKQHELGFTDKAKIGMLMGAVMKELAGKADGADVKLAVEKLFS